MQPSIRSIQKNYVAFMLDFLKDERPTLAADKDSPSPWRNGEFSVNYRYVSAPESLRFSTVTEIRFQYVTVWELHSLGWCDPQAIPFLKCSWQDAYQHNLLGAGRGQPMRSEPPLIYLNTIECNDRTRAGGKETLYTTENDVCLGEIWYRSQFFLKE